MGLFWKLGFCQLCYWTTLKNEFTYEKFRREKH